ncbi:MAG TPA: hypothetical protein VN695_17190 [Streptosporangiaceae bacterium]|nr:hypothetical protein [Streptosporangiaceae bacterium]
MSQQDQSGDQATPAGGDGELGQADFAEHAEHAEFAEFAERAEHAEYAEYAEHVEHLGMPATEAAAIEQEKEQHHRLHHLLSREAADGHPDVVWRAEMLHLLNAANKLSAAGMSKLHRQDRPEPRWPVSTAVIVAIVLQALLPKSLALRPVWLHYVLFALEGALLIALFAANPIRIERMTRPIRSASIAVIFLITASNTVSAISLVNEIVTNRLHVSTAQNAAVALFLSGAAIWGTNVIAFALWYWEFDRGGPVARLEGRHPYPDLLFTQMSEPELTRPGWGPQFID